MKSALLIGWKAEKLIVSVWWKRQEAPPCAWEGVGRSRSWRTPGNSFCQPTMGFLLPVLGATSPSGFLYNSVPSPAKFYLSWELYSFPGLTNILIIQGGQGQSWLNHAVMSPLYGVLAAICAMWLGADLTCWQWITFLDICYTRVGVVSPFWSFLSSPLGCLTAIVGLMDRPKMGVGRALNVNLP